MSRGIIYVLAQGATTITNRSICVLHWTDNVMASQKHILHTVTTLLCLSQCSLGFTFKTCTISSAFSVQQQRWRHSTSTATAADTLLSCRSRIQLGSGRRHHKDVGWNGHVYGVRIRERFNGADGLWRLNGQKLQSSQENDTTQSPKDVESASEEPDASTPPSSSSQTEEEGGGGLAEMPGTGTNDPGFRGKEAISRPGVGWTVVGSVFVTQLAAVCFCHWLAGPYLRQQIGASIHWSLADAGKGVLGVIPLVLTGFLQERTDWDWVRKIEEITKETAIMLFGAQRKVATVVALVIPLAAFIGFAEEWAFRGYLPLFLSAKTGLPTAAVVGLSGIIFGAAHAATVAYFVEATIAGVFFHCLLLCTGNILVPIVAHGVYDAIALVRCHLKSTKPE